MTSGVDLITAIFVDDEDADRITDEQRLRWALNDLLAAIAQCATTKELEAHESYRRAKQLVWSN